MASVERDLKSRTLAELAFQHLREDILRARLRPGEKLHIERISEGYGVGATPLREALSRLSSMGLVTAEGQRGFRVASVSIDNLLDITKARAWIEATALRAAVARGDRDWEAEIVASAHRLGGFSPTDMAGLSDEWDRANRLFHNALVSACDSPQLMAFRELLYDQSDRYRRLSVRDGLAGRDLGEEHQAIMQAVLARDAERAIERVHDHFLETTRTILSTYMAGGADARKVMEQLRKDVRAGSGFHRQQRKQARRAKRRLRA